MTDETRRNAVVMAADSAYAPFAFFLAWQVATLSPGRRFDILVLTVEPMPLPPLLAGLGVRGEVLPPLPEIAALHAGRVAPVTYARMFLPALLAGRYSRILYLDSDLCFAGGDLNRLFATDLRGKALGKARDQIQYRDPSRPVAEHRAMGLAPAPYYNSGVMLMDVDTYNASGGLARMLALAAARPEILRIQQDQSLLNIGMAGEIAELHPVWNWMANAEAAWLGHGLPIRFHHFFGPRKPWGGPAAPLDGRFVAAYADFFAAVMPEALPMVTRKPRRQVLSFIETAEVLRGVMRMRKGMAALLGRFEDEWHVARP